MNAPLAQPLTVDKLAWTPIRDRKVLFARSKKEPVFFYCTGGKRDKKPDGSMETDLEALLREVREETGVLLIYNTIRHLHTFEGPCHGYPEGTVLRMTCYIAECDGEPEPTSEIAELAWFTTADLHRTTEMGQQILRWLHEQGLID